MISNVNQRLQQEINLLLENREALVVLEAGCGSVSHIKIPNVGKMVGIDISEKQLQRNAQLDVKIVGDLQTYPLEKRGYDVIVSWDVLEHLDNPKAALDNFFEATSKKGILILAAPNIVSIKGVVTKLMPHSLQVAFYRYVIGDTRAGIDDQGPFKAYLRKAMWPEQIKKTALAKGFSVPYMVKYEGPVPKHLRSRSKIVNVLFGFIGWFSKIVLGKNNDLTDSDYMIILQRD